MMRSTARLSPMQTTLLYLASGTWLVLANRAGIQNKSSSKCAKAVAYCENPENINVPELFNRYNGKPALITNSGYVIKDPEGEWMEIGVDVRKFNALCRKMLCSFRDRIPLTKIHYGFMIQGVEDEELPEALLCDLHCVGIDIMEDPVKIPNTT
eukprot:TRINITY_DN10444_c0_g1_i2.p1 TRINITY_DN10444_c0_g1~~TRINITY_DN10444_c0_g1_i2.p1  ORF type:complete len:154 (-),score=24.44 TRINITY_DN10444_c0_g1_i2:318-779(-)